MSGRTTSICTVLAMAGIAATAVHASPFMIVGNDEKLVWDDEGKAVLSAPGKDNVLIVDLANMNESRWVQLTGNSGHPFHPNYDDQLELWRTGQTITFRFDRKSIEEEKTQTLTLTP